MKAVVIYQSKTGFTKKYAEWIAEELGADLFPRAKVTAAALADYDTIVYGGGLYVSGINGVGFIKENLDKLPGKKIAVFCCGCTPPRDEDIKAVRDKNFSPEELKRLGLFYMRGGFNYKKLGLVDKFLMTVLKWKLKTRKNPTHDEQGMLAVYARPADFTRRKNIEPLVEYLRA